MTVITFENTEKIPHLIKTNRELAKKHPEIEEWPYAFWSRCSRCQNIFVSTTERKYCSKVCQYNQKKNESDWAKTEPLEQLWIFCEKCRKVIVDEKDLFQRVKKRRDPFVPTYSYFCKICYYEKEGNQIE